MNWQNPFSPSGTDTTAAEQFNGREGETHSLYLDSQATIQLARTLVSCRER